MGLFFKKRGNAKKRTKVNIILNTITAIAMVVLLIMAIINGLDFVYFKLIFIVAGISSMIDGVESYLQKENRKVYFRDFGYAMVWFVLAFFYSNIEGM